MRRRKLFKNQKRDKLAFRIAAQGTQIAQLIKTNRNLMYGNDTLKQQHKALLKAPDNVIKKDLNEAINIILDYQKTLFRLKSPDPNIQRANDLLNKWGVRSQRVHGMFKVMMGEEEITMGREF